MQLEIPAQTAVHKPTTLLATLLPPAHFSFPVAHYNFFSLGLQFGQQLVKEFVGSGIQGTTQETFPRSDLPCGCPSPLGTGFHEPKA